MWLHYRTKAREEIQSRKRTYYANKVQHLKTSDPRKWWGCVNQIAGKKKSSSNISITRNGVTVSGDGLASVLNDHFSSVSADLPLLDLYTLPAFLPAPEPPPSVTCFEVFSKLLKMQPFKSPGPDGIPNRVIKEYAYELSEPVTMIFNQSILSGLVPEPWKDADLIPVPKTKLVTCEDELRPISLTANLSKVLEDFVVTWMIHDIRHKIDAKQFGSLKGSSTTFCLIDMINNWLQTLDTPSHYLRVCFLDFSKAFDRINHNILITKLIALGMRRSLIPWICDFLRNRRQAVKIKGLRSEWAYVNGGVPQGTKLGPVLFLVMINDLEMRSSNAIHWKYVDDVTITEAVSAQGESSLQADLDQLQLWADVNDMKLNSKKCKEMTISFLRETPDCTPLQIDGQCLDHVSSFKILGVTINNRLKWDNNVEMIVEKASKRLYILRVLSRNGIPPTDLLSIYYALIRSVLEYACEVWHTSLPQYLASKIELVQKRAMRILYPDVHYADALSITDCSRLDQRRQKICFKTFLKITQSNSQLHKLLPQTRENAHGRKLRNKDNYSLPKCRTNRYKNSFIPAMCYTKSSF